MNPCDRLLHQTLCLVAGILLAASFDPWSNNPAWLKVGAVLYTLLAYAYPNIVIRLAQWQGGRES